jgi:hypothetical protein
MMLARLACMAVCLGVCLACREENSGAPLTAASGSGGSAGIGGSAGVAGAGPCAGAGGVGSLAVNNPDCSPAQCQSAAANVTFNGCLICEGIRCQAEDTCTAPGHSNGPASTGCSCRDGRYECWIAPYPSGGGGSGGGAAICERTIAESASASGCLACSGLACASHDSCSMPLGDGGPGASRCVCVDGAFSCSRHGADAGTSADAGQ